MISVELLHVQTIEPAVDEELVGQDVHVPVFSISQNVLDGHLHVEPLDTEPAGQIVQPFDMILQ